MDRELLVGCGKHHCYKNKLRLVACASTLLRCDAAQAAVDGSLRSMSEIVTAGILVIGDEILSGRTKDKNIGFIAEYLTNIGIDLKEVRVVADDEDDIVNALNA